MGFASKTAEEVLAELGSSRAGLDSHEAAARLKRFGRNEAERVRKRRALGIFISQFTSPLVIILFFAALLSGFLGDLVQAGIIIAILLTNAVLGFIQEFKSEQALEKLAKYISRKARVFRDGRLVEVDMAELVPGDVVELEIGDIVPADVRLVSATAFSADESVLSGESAPAEKSTEPVRKASPTVPEMRNMAFAGTHVASGTAVGVVVSTGKNTEFGKTATMLRARAPETDFELNIRKFGDMFLAVIAVMTVFIFIVNAFLGKDWFVSLLFALAVAVGITPEMLPIIITITLSSGALALAGKKVVVKRLASIEDLGDMDVLCTDKTGTLTENALFLEKHVNALGETDERVLLNALLCSQVTPGRRHPSGTPFDMAVWEYSHRMGFGHRLKEFRQVEVIPFDFERRRMSTVMEDASGARRIYCKGSVDSVLKACSKAAYGKKYSSKKECMKKVMKAYEDYSAQGYRLLAVAGRKVERKRAYSQADEKNLEFYGLLIFSDPPKKTAPAAIKKLEALGVQLKIISGDNPLVTAHVCRQVGLAVRGGKVFTGSDYASFDRAGRAKAVEKYNVFARMTPEQKHEVILLLKENGHITGFLGDGVNDAPALHVSDVGISVDTGAEIAKEAADIVLLKQDLTVIADGIAEGRKTFNNTSKYIRNTISANFGNMFTLSLASLFLPFIPLPPVQILLNNFISDVPLTAVSTDSVDEEDLRTPKRWDIGAITRFMIFFGAISSIFDLLMIYFLRNVVMAPKELFWTGWFLESVLSEIVVTFAIRTRKAFYKSRPSALLLATSAIAIAGTIGLLYTPLAPLFQLVPLDAEFLFVILGITCAYFIIAELAKHLFFRYYKM